MSRMIRSGERRYHVAHRGRKFGPFTLAQLTTRNLADDMAVWYEGLPEWVPITELEELRDYVRNTPPLRTTAPPIAPGTGISQAASQTERREPASPEAPALVLPPLPVDASGAASRSPVFGLPKTLALLQIVFGTLGLLCGPLLALWFITGEQVGPPEFVAIVQQSHVVVFQVVMAGLGFLLSGTMLAAGVLMLMGKAWGRRLGVAVAVTSIILWLISSMGNCSLISYPIWQLARVSESPEAVGVAIGGIVGGAIGGIIALAYQAVMLILLNRKSVKEVLT